MKKNILIVLVLAAFGTGCAHSHKVLNSDKSLEPSQQVQVGIGSPEVQKGEVVDVFTRTCSAERFSEKGRNLRSCTMNKVGEAKIEKLISEKVASVTPLNNLVIDPKMYVEKKKQ